MKKIALTSIKMLGLAGLALTANTSLAAGIEDTSVLPVIVDDCGGEGCADRRQLTMEQFQSLLSSAANGETHAESQDAVAMAEDLYYGVGREVPQLVYLNFEQSSPTFQAVAFSGVPEVFVSHTYTQEERDAIQANIESAYTDFKIKFTQTEPTEGDYSTLNFECQTASGICIDFGNGILFGRAQAIDLGNTNRNDSAFVDANLWEVTVQLDPTGGFFSRVSGIPVVDGDVQAALSVAIVNQASNTGAHELGHNLGLRHHDSFGSPGSGLPSTGVPSPDAFFPVFDGLQEGDEAILHTMASGASVGSGLTDSTTRNRFFSERSAIKLKAAERGLITPEGDLSTAQTPLRLRNVNVPNTILNGDNANKELRVKAAIIEGAIDNAGEMDYYRFHNSKPGITLSAEFNGFDVAVGDSVIGALRLFYIEPDGTLTLVAQNFQNFEGFDAFLIDAPLDKAGDYIIEVSAPNFVSFGYDEVGDPILFPLDETGNGA
ncbi:MAG: hypothetical protein ACPGJI_09970, partial [Kangiellaceae bacterium]